MNCGSDAAEIRASPFSFFHLTASHSAEPCVGLLILLIFMEPPSLVLVSVALNVSFHNPVGLVEDDDFLDHANRNVRDHPSRVKFRLFHRAP